MKKTIIMLTIFMIIIASVISNTSKVIIPKEAIRFRVIANSDSNLDQKEKKKIAKQLSVDVMNVLEETESIEEARIKIKDNITNFQTSVEEVAKKDNYETTVKVDYGNHYFPEKEYKGVTYKEGEYESLVVTLGEGNGANFWCVLFPPLCLLEAEEEDTNEVEYKSFVKELIDKYF